MWFSERVINVGEIKVNQATCNVMAEHFENLKNNSMASVDEGDDTSPLIDLDENKIAARTPQNIFHRRHASAISTNFDLKGISNYENIMLPLFYLHIFSYQVMNISQKIGPCQWDLRKIF